MRCRDHPGAWHRPPRLQLGLGSGLLFAEFAMQVLGGRVPRCRSDAAELDAAAGLVLPGAPFGERPLCFYTRDLGLGVLVEAGALRCRDQRSRSSVAAVRAAVTADRDLRIAARLDIGWTQVWSSRHADALATLLSVAEEASDRLPVIAWDAIGLAATVAYQTGGTPGSAWRKSGSAVENSDAPSLTSSDR